MDTVDVVVRNPAAGQTDDYGDGPTGDAPDPVTIAGCLFAPRASTERTDPRTPAVITDGTLYIEAPQLELARQTIRAASLVDVPGRGTFSVQGDLGIWGTAGIEVALQRWTGRAA